MFRRRDALSPFVLFVILVQAYWPINLIMLSALKASGKNET
ncbi:MAG: hypothetical protein WBL46_05520 [Nitrososphaeraceae archaeon]